MIQPSHARGRVEAKLGAPTSSGGNGVIPYYATYDHVHVIINYRLLDPDTLDNPIANIGIFA